MRIKRGLGLIATSFGGLLLALTAIELALLFYYRPTLEYAFVGTYVVGAQQRAAPSWMTGELVGVVFGAVLGTAGVMLLWAGRTLRRTRHGIE
jgi:hypothetical protein